MTNNLTLIEFVPGTKAKAQEVNSNFSTLKDAVVLKANYDGDSAQTFSVASPTLSEHAVNQSSLDEVVNVVNTKIDTLLNRFCIVGGNITEGFGDLMNYSGTTLSFKVGSSYDNLIWISADGTKEELATIADITGLSTDGTYSIVRELDGIDVLSTASTITQGIVFPASPADGNYHCLIASGIQTYKRVGGEWVETQYIKLGTVTVQGSVITEVKTTPFFQNGFDTNTQSVQKYDSGFFPVVSNSVYTKSHNLGTTDIKYVVLIADDANGLNQRPCNDLYAPTGTNYGWYGREITKSTLQVGTGTGGIGLKAISAPAIQTSGYYRILAEVL